MKAPAAFCLTLALAGLAAVAVLRVTRPDAVRTPPAASPAARVVLAGHAATYGLAHALARGTGIEVVSAWPAGLPWAEQAEHARQGTAALAAPARRAAAVVSLRHATAEDALFATVRAVNPRAVEIDASVARDQRTPNVRLRAGEAGGPAFALGPSNAMRMAERIADDFAALWPDTAPAVEENLRATKERLLRLKAEFDGEFAAVAAPEVVAFSPQFDHLLDEFGVQVLARVEPDEALWTEAERAAVAEKLRQSGARASVHAFPPGAATRALLAAANIRAVVLDPQTKAPSGPEDYFQRLRESLAALRAALQ